MTAGRGKTSGSSTSGRHRDAAWLLRRAKPSSGACLVRSSSRKRTTIGSVSSTGSSGSVFTPSATTRCSISRSAASSASALTSATSSGASDLNPSTTNGVSRSAGAFTSRISHSTARATLDDSFREKRRMCFACDGWLTGAAEAKMSVHDTMQTTNRAFIGERNRGPL